MLPEPTLSFTLPSLEGGTLLDCRIYHPRCLTPASNREPWKRHSAIVAHPYGPMGGCYDDGIVDLLASTLLRTGYLVATFNFRGAGKSAGRTSWTAKPERRDYMSIVGFVLFYTHFLDPFRRHEGSLNTPSEAASSLADHPQLEPSKAPILLMCGYSYGAMITTQIPPLSDILPLFTTPEVGSPASEIRLRAKQLAEQENNVIASVLAAKMEHGGHKNLSVRVGFEQDQRRSQESRRSFSLEEAEEKLRKGCHDLAAKMKHTKKVEAPEEKDHTPHNEEMSSQKLGPIDIVAPRAAYLLVSPLQGLINHLATMSLKPPSSISSLFSKKSKPAAPTNPTTETEEQSNGTELTASERKLVESPTLAVFGDGDVFVPVQKLRDWVKRLQDVKDSRFVAQEFPNAGHFWVEERVAYDMRDRVGDFASELLSKSW